MVIEYTIHPDVLAAAMKEWAEIDAFLEQRNLPRSALNYTHWAAGDVMPSGQRLMLAPSHDDSTSFNIVGNTIELKISPAIVDLLDKPLLSTPPIMFATFGQGDTRVNLALRLSGQPMPTQAETEAYTQLMVNREANEQAKPSAEWLAQIAARQDKTSE